MFMWRKKQNVKVPVRATPLDKPHSQFERSNFEKKLETTNIKAPMKSF